MRKNSLAVKILFYIYSMQVVPQKSIRFLDKNYDHVGKVLKALKDSGYINENKIKSETVLTLTDTGYGELNNVYSKLCKEYFNDSSTDICETVQKQLIKKENFLDFKMLDALKKYVKGDKNKNRQLKLAYSLAMIYRYVPNCIANYLNIESRHLAGEIAANSDTKSTLTNEIQNRIDGSRWFVMTREMRLLDEAGLKKMNSLRAHGILHLETGNYAIYNHMSSRMRSYNEFEQKFKTLIESWLRLYIPEERLKALIFAKSYKVALDTIQNKEKNRSNFLLTNGVYGEQYYVPLTGDGAKQIEVFTILHFHETVRDGLINQEDIDRASNSIYDGITEQGDIIYLGFECNLNEIKAALDCFNTKKIDKSILIYCFEWQKNFYKELFGERATVKTVVFDKLVEYAKEQS